MIGNIISLVQRDSLQSLRSVIYSLGLLIFKISCCTFKTSVVLKVLSYKKGTESKEQQGHNMAKSRLAFIFILKLLWDL